MPGEGGGEVVLAREDADMSGEAIFDAAVQEAAAEMLYDEFRQKLSQNGGFTHQGTLEFNVLFMLRPLQTDQKDLRFDALHAYFLEQVKPFLADLNAEAHRIYGSDVLTPVDVVTLMEGADQETDIWLSEQLKRPSGSGWDSDSDKP